MTNTSQLRFQSTAGPQHWQSIIQRRLHQKLGMTLNHWRKDSWSRTYGVVSFGRAFRRRRLDLRRFDDVRRRRHLGRQRFQHRPSCLTFTPSKSLKRTSERQRTWQKIKSHFLRFLEGLFPVPTTTTSRWHRNKNSNLSRFFLFRKDR